MDALIPGLSRKLKSGIDFLQTMSLWPCFAGGYLEHFGTYVHEVWKASGFWRDNTGLTLELDFFCMSSLV